MRYFRRSRRGFRRTRVSRRYRRSVRRFNRRRGWRSRTRGFSSARITRFKNYQLPQALYTKLSYKWVGTIGYASAHLADAASILKLNCPYDPLYGTSNSAQGYQYWATHYRRYLCTSAVLYLTVINTTAKPIGVFAIPQQGPDPPAIATSTTFENIVNLPNCKYKILTAQGTPGSKKTFKIPWSIKRDQGLGTRAKAWELSDYDAQVNADPTNIRYAFWGSFSPNNSVWGESNASACNAQATIVYKTKFFQRYPSPMIVT